MSITIIALLFVAYIIGSVPSAVWIGKVFHGIDVSQFIVDFTKHGLAIELKKLNGEIYSLFQVMDEIHPAVVFSQHAIGVSYALGEVCRERKIPAILISHGSHVPHQQKFAEIEFKETVIDYGIIENGEDGSRVFEFTNTGNAPLTFSRIFSSCGCTIPKKPEKPVLPGENGKIEVKYDTKRTGIFQKAITVNSNAKTANVILRIKGEVLPELEEEEKK